ncbi:MAG: hypothetical protein JO206_05640 [Solirubrobacterales bacterium]|nr:hypothetical protein [Solirubrobacterales bacterium]MBV9472430.1 hypothetical protein [Solirubrobacterales bacterium]
MTILASSSKVLLVADRRGDAGESGATRVRRYRLARVRLENRPSDAADGVDQPKRA